ncbi:MAG: bifunctional oligoribonuclease/PAP phosphatase NrnA [Candidatus Eisenbacteria bacterium]|uniref:Bifunctional oligoribonuclease/PAP phosphatase NrnA n=1 Tax=Eiseniibacteriota bacterium TaxID=2212470 RepID=A0A948W4I7_UNCEI|nr:bifunctional oligoribonuclease/PAP phosphatase NrnA [Candidatus Eisenbacteria bacterium]MBU2689394.1 bifunctional oligoribonuclease/PAP phosphatase NrnA [Candidatus Eisenbacteria bacterium]
MASSAQHSIAQTPAWDRLDEMITDAPSILLASHIFPEADSLGSEVALALYLKTMGKKVRICNPTPALPSSRFLEKMASDHGIAIETGRPELEDAGLVIILDVCDWDHMGALGAVIRDSGLPKVCLDHHSPRGEFADLDVIEPDAASAGEIVFRYLEARNAEITPEIATAIYASLIFDTGCFRLRNTRDETITLAARLIEFGASHGEICRLLFENENYGHLELLRMALGSLVTECHGRLAWTVITEGMFSRTGTNFNDADGILDHLVMIENLEVGVLFRDWEEGGVKVTFRSKGRVDVSSIARRLGGGGRPTAAGVLLPFPLREALETVLPRIRKILGGGVM